VPTVPPEFESKRKKFNDDLVKFNHSIGVAKRQFDDATTSARDKKGKKKGDMYLI
jgi:hypothetical protein